MASCVSGVDGRAPRGRHKGRESHLTRDPWNGVTLWVVWGHS